MKCICNYLNPLERVGNAKCDVHAQRDATDYDNMRNALFAVVALLSPNTKRALLKAIEEELKKGK